MMVTGLFTGQCLLCHQLLFLDENMVIFL